MAKIAKHFSVTKILPQKFGSIEFSGIVYNNDPENYDIEDVHFTTINMGQQITEDVTHFFHMFRACTDPEFHHTDIVNLLHGWLRTEKANRSGSLVKEAA